MMRHVSRAHRVAFDRLFDGINLDPKIQIKYVDTKNQLADNLTEGSFTRDEWDRISRCFLAAIFFQTESRRFGSGETESNEFGFKEPLDCEEDPPQDSSDPNSTRNQELDQSCVSSSGRKLTRKHQPKPSNVFLMEARQDDTQSSSTRKLGWRDEPSSSARARKLERGEDIQIGRSKMEFHNVLISDVDLL